MTRPTRLLAFLGTAALLLGGCSVDEIAPGTPVVTTPHDTLTVAALRDILLRSPAMPTVDEAYGASSIWTDLAIVRGSVMDGSGFSDDATIAAVIEPMVIEGTIIEYSNSRTGLVTPSETQIDSLARTGSVRVFRRFAAGSQIAPEDSAAVTAGAELLFNFRQQADVEGSAEAALRALGGSAGSIRSYPGMAASRPELPEPIAEAIWRLGDNEMSLPMYGMGEVQMFQRVPADSARGDLAQWLAPRLQRHADSREIDSLVASRNLAVARGAVERMRGAAIEPMVVSGSEPLVTWDGGELTGTEARMWLATMPAPERARFRIHSDSTLSNAIALMGQREILLEFASGHGADRTAVRSRIVGTIGTVLDDLAAEARSVENPTTWMLEVLQGQRAFRPLPGALPAVLRDRMAVTIDHNALSAALVEAVRSWRPPQQ